MKLLRLRNEVSIIVSDGGLMHTGTRKLVVLVQRIVALRLICFVELGDIQSSGCS